MAAPALATEDAREQLSSTTPPMSALRDGAARVYWEMNRRFVTSCYRKAAGRRIVTVVP